MKKLRGLIWFANGFALLSAISPLLMVGAGCKPPPAPVAQESRQREPQKPETPESEAKPKPFADQPSESEQERDDSARSEPAKHNPSPGQGKSQGNPQGTPDSKSSPSAQEKGAPKGKPQSGIGSSAGDGSSDAFPRGKSASPEQAAKGAGELFGVAKKEKERGNAAAAFETAVRAWELASEFPEDKKCSDLVGELNAFIEQQSTAANQKAGARGDIRRSGKPLIVK